jgi:hypothetical protein
MSEGDTKLLREFGVSYSPQEAYQMFVEPFADVLAVAKVGLSDVLSSAKLNLDVFLSFSPKSIKKAEEDWKGRKSAIDSKYSTLLQKIDSDAGADANLFAFMLNPSLFLASKAVKASVGPGGVADFLKDSGFDAAALGALGFTVSIADGPSSAQPADAPGVLSKLKSLFFLPEGYNVDLQLITEDDEGTSSTSDIAIEIEQYLQELGILDEISNDAKTLISSKKEIIEALGSEVKKREEAILPLYNAETPEDFKKALSIAKNSGLEFSGLDTVGKELDSSVGKTLNDPSAVAKIKEKSKEELTDDEIRDSVEKAVFMTAIQPLREKIYEFMSSLEAEADRIIMQDMPSKEYYDMLKQTKLGKELISVAARAKESLSS